MEIHTVLPSGIDMGELQVEVDERKRAQEELCHLNMTLEQRLARRDAELAAAKDELRQDNRRLSQDRKEISRLEENLSHQSETLARQTLTIENLNRELESLNYSISHDLRAPIRHLIGFSGALLEDYGDQLDGTAHTFLDSIAKAARKIDSQVEALLKMSRITRQELNLTRVDLSRLVHDCAASLQQASPQRRVRFTIADKVSVRADAALLRTALENLLDNAWKFTGTRDSATIEFGHRQEGEGTVYFVRDNGVGYEMKYADRLFGAFQRLHRSDEFEGVGVGLATVQRIIHRHGGRIWAEAALDAGATFYFTLSTEPGPGN